MLCAHSNLNNCILFPFPSKCQQDTATPITCFANPNKTKLLKPYIPRNIKNAFTQQSRGILAANGNIFVLPWKIQQGHNSSKVGFGTLARYEFMREIRKAFSTCSKSPPLSPPVPEQNQFVVSDTSKCLAGWSHQASQNRYSAHWKHLYLGWCHPCWFIFSGCLTSVNALHYTFAWPCCGQTYFVAKSQNKIA